MKHIYRALLCVALLFSWQGVAAQDLHEHLGSTSVAEELHGHLGSTSVAEELHEHLGSTSVAEELHEHLGSTSVAEELHEHLGSTSVAEELHEHLGSTSVAEELKIISFNIRYNSWENIDGENGWPYRKAAVVRMILQERPAAIGLQEALIDQLQYLDSNLPGYQRIGVGRDDGKEAGEFMAIYYDTAQLRLDNSQTIWLSETPKVPSKGWDAACYRTATVANFFDRRTARNFYYVNTHLDHVGMTARAKSAKLLASFFTPSMSALVVPAIVGGDMNSSILDTALLAFDYVHLTPACDQVSTKLCHAITYNAFGKGPGASIDHFFVRGDIEVKQYRILDGDYGVPYISDHYPIEMVIRL